MIMFHAMAWSHPSDPVKNGTALAIIKAVLLAMVRAMSVPPRAADKENPRLMIALIAVMDAQTMNGSVIQSPMAARTDRARRGRNALGIALS
jgi:hypothetical protein